MQPSKHKETTFQKRLREASNFFFEACRVPAGCGRWIVRACAAKAFGSKDLPWLIDHRRFFKHALTRTCLWTRSMAQWTTFIAAIARLICVHTPFLGVSNRCSRKWKSFRNLNSFIEICYSPCIKYRHEIYSFSLNFAKCHICEPSTLTINNSYGFCSNLRFYPN